MCLQIQYFEDYFSEEQELVPFFSLAQTDYPVLDFLCSWLRTARDQRCVRLPK